MNRILLYAASSIPIISLILLIMCGELPTDPKDNPNNVNATFFITGSSEIHYQDQAVEIGIIVLYPALTKSIRVSFGDNLPKDTLYCDTTQSGNFDTVKTIRTYSDSGKKSINIDVDLINGSVKQFHYEFRIAPKELTVTFDTVPPNHSIETGKPDTMTFTASTSPAGGAIEFTAESQPSLNASNLKIVDLGSKAQVITTAPSDTSYDITVIAKSGTTTKSATVKIKSEKKAILQEKSSVTAMLSGTSDTLVFSIGARESDTINSVVILNATAFKTGEIMPVVTGKDTLSFVFTPAETKVYTFSVEVTMKNKKDTLSYNISVTKETLLFTVTYFGNGNTGGSVPVDVNKYEFGSPVTIAPVDSLLKSGFTFAGWNTAADGSGILRTAGGSFPMGNADVSLYAQWVVTTVQPSIVTQPTSQAVCAGSQVSFSVIASGTAPLTYQWRKGVTSFTDIPNATGVTYSFTPTSLDNATILSCLVSNGGTVNAASNLCTLTVNSASTKPTATATPATVCSGSSSVLSVSAGALGTGASWKWYTSRTSATVITSTTVSPSASAWYYVKGTGGSCEDSPWDSVYITVNTQSTAPASITASAATVCSGNPDTLRQSGGILGTGATWQWFTDSLCTQSAAGTPNADGSQFIVTPSLNTTYYVKAIGNCDTTTAVKKTINISTQSSAPTGIASSTPSVCPGNPVTLSVSGGSLGSGAKWKWYTNSLFTMAAVGTSTDISGSPITVTPSSQTTYYVRAEGTCGNTTAANRTINVYTPPVFTTPLVGGEVCQPGEGNFGNYEVSATGNAPLTYAWYTGDETPLTNNGMPYVSIPATAAGNIDFYCIVTDVNGCSTKSNTVTQTAHQPIVITSQPADTFGYVGYDYTFAVIATGYGTLNYQWQYQLPDSTWASLPLGTGASVATHGYFDGYNQDGNWNIKIRCKITNILGCEIYSQSANLHVWGI